MPTPDPNDDVLDVVIGDVDDNDNNEDNSIGDNNMPTEIPEAMHVQNLGRLAQAGLQAHEHFVQFGKVLDLSYEQDRKMVSLVESLGVREVTSASGQAGIPANASGN